MYIVRFIRKDGKPNEEYYYQSLEAARNHVNLFYDDDSELYTSIALVKVDGKTSKTITRLVF